MKKKIVIIIIASVLLLLLVAVGSVCFMFHKQYSAAQSIEQVADDMYTMTYNGDYGLDAFLEQGGAKNTAELRDFIIKELFYGMGAPSAQPTEFGCSFITVKDKVGKVLTGRNFDWPDCKSDIAVIHTCPDHGYASVSTANLFFLGIGKDWKPESMQDKMMMIAALYTPLDGMNEKGLVVADLVAGDKVRTDQETDLPDVTTTTAIRLLLDKADNVEKALSLLKGIDMHSDIDYSHHLAISDASGRSVVVEWVDNKMLVVDSPLCTNHYLADSPKKDYSIYSEDSHRRFNSMQQMRDSLKTMTSDDVRESISRVASKDMTRWSVVFDSKALTATYYQYCDFSKPYTTGVK